MTTYTSMQISYFIIVQWSLKNECTKATCIYFYKINLVTDKMLINCPGVADPLGGLAAVVHRGCRGLCHGSHDLMGGDHVCPFLVQQSAWLDCS